MDAVVEALTHPLDPLNLSEIAEAVAILKGEKSLEANQSVFRSSGWRSRRKPTWRVPRRQGARPPGLHPLARCQHGRDA